MSACVTVPEEKLRQATADGNLLRVETFLGQGVHAQSADERRITPLSVAVQGGRQEMVALRLENGAQVNEQAQIGGVTLLHVEAYPGDQEIIHLLLQHGVDKQARMSSGERPVDTVQQQGHHALIPRLEP